MKKLSIFAAMLLAVGFTSCVEIDNPVEDNRQVISLDGVNYKSDLVATFTGEVGAEVSLGLGVYENYGIYGVDFGDGVILTDSVGNQNKGIIGDDGLTKEGTTHTGTTKFEGTISGDGIVKVYGNQKPWYILCSGGICPTGLDQEKLLDVVQVSISGANVEEIVLPEMKELKQFSFNNSPLKSIDVSKATGLTSLTINNTSMSKYESQLESIDLSKNTELDYLSIQGNTDVAGKLTSIDLSNNENLTKVYLQYNALTEVKLPANAALSILNVQNNNLAALDLSVVKSIKDIYASDNKLAAVDLSKLVAKATLNLYNNQLTALDVPVDAKTILAYNNKISQVSIQDVTSKLELQDNKLSFSALPDKPAGMKKAANYKYAPQDVVIPVAISGGAIDLTKEYGPFKGITENDNLTSFAFKADGADMPAENYKLDGGKVNFLHVYNVVYAELTNPAFPDLTLETTRFAVGFGTPVLYETLFTYDFAAAAAVGENPGNFNGNQNNGQGFYGWEKADKTDSRRNDYKGYTWAEGSVLPADCHVYRRSDRINGNIKEGGLYCPNDREMAIDGLEPGYLVEIFYEGEGNMMWAIGDGTSEEGGVVRATALINGAEAVTGETEFTSGAGILVKSVTPAVKGTGYIVFKVKKGMVITKVIISKPE